MTSLKKTAGWLAAALLIPITVSAAPVTWNFAGGSITTSVNASGFPVGTPLSLSFMFDPTTFSGALADPGGAWSVRAGNNMHFSVGFAFDCDTDTPEHDSCTDEASGSAFGEVWLLNNFLGSANDEILFSLFTEGLGEFAERERWNFRLTGPGDIFGPLTPSTQIPTTVDSRFSVAQFSVCESYVPNPNPANTYFPAFAPCENGDPEDLYVVGRFAVPEPVTLTLLGAGIAGIGFARRRRRVI